MLIILCGVSQLDAAERIKVPLNFKWGQPMQQVEETLKRANARVTERRTVSGKQVITVEGLPDPRATRLREALFYFQNEGLCEVEYRYSDPSWDASKINEIFEKTRQMLYERHGESRNIAKQRSMENGVLQTVIGYQWTQEETTLRLFLYTAEQGNEAYRVLSYHYRAS
jgi:hypothetical protein